MSNPRATIFDSVGRLLGHGATRSIATLRRALPQQCALCAGASGDARLCRACAHSLPALGPTCPSCALPVPGGEPCGACLRRPPPQTRTIAAVAYAFPADRLIAQLKYGHEIALGPSLASLLADALRRFDRMGERLPDVIVPMPLAVDRQRERGFNQACEIARPLARTLARPLLHALVRVRNTPAQASLPKARRAANVKDAFRTVSAVRGLRIAVVDDVMTTGATLSATARTLLGAGANEVEGWVVARTLPPGAAL